MDLQGSDLNRLLLSMAPLCATPSHSSPSDSEAFNTLLTRNEPASTVEIPMISVSEGMNFAGLKETLDHVKSFASENGFVFKIGRSDKSDPKVHRPTSLKLVCERAKSWIKEGCLCIS